MTNTFRAYAAGVAVVVLSLGAGRSFAKATPQGRLSDCQKTVQSAAAAFISGKTVAAGACLQKIAGEVIGLSGPDVGVAAALARKTCTAQLKKIPALRAKMVAQVAAKCASVAGGFVFRDISGKSAVLQQPLDTKNLDGWCANFGGSGTIATVTDWANCLANAHQCAADAAIAVQYPRAVEWLLAVQPAIAPTETSALAALDELTTAIGGGNKDTTAPHVQCGSTTCGNGVLNANEQCEGADLGGATCQSLGFSDGTLSCTASCRYNVDACVPVPAGTQVIPLAPAYNSCTASNTSDTFKNKAGCDPPVLSSTALKFGPNGQGSVTLTAIPGDILIDATVTDVRTVSDTLYTGNLTLSGGQRISEFAGQYTICNGPVPCTLADSSQETLIPCINGTCTRSTTAFDEFCAADPLCSGCLVNPQLCIQFGIYPYIGTITVNFQGVQVLDVNSDPFLVGGFQLH